MSRSTGKKNSESEAELEKKKTRRYALIFISVVGIVFLAFWFGREWLAPEKVISITSVTVNGRSLGIQLSEKKGRQNFRDRMLQVEAGNPHYAYFLELKDLNSEQVLSKVRFKSPVMNIQETPVVIIVQDVLWLISTTRSEHRDTPGFILKFSISSDAIEPQDFHLDEKYFVRELNGSRIYLSDGSGVFTYDHTFYGGLYLDLGTEKIIDDRHDSQ